MTWRLYVIAFCGLVATALVALWPGSGGARCTTLVLWGLQLWLFRGMRRIHKARYGHD